MKLVPWNISPNKCRSENYFTLPIEQVALKAGLTHSTGEFSGASWKGSLCEHVDMPTLHVGHAVSSCTQIWWWRPPAPPCRWMWTSALPYLWLQLTSELSLLPRKYGCFCCCFRGKADVSLAGGLWRQMGCAFLGWTPWEQITGRWYLACEREYFNLPNTFHPHTLFLVRAGCLKRKAYSAYCEM